MPVLGISLLHGKIKSTVVRIKLGELYHNEDFLGDNIYIEVKKLRLKVSRRRLQIFSYLMISLIGIKIKR